MGRDWLSSARAQPSEVVDLLTELPEPSWGSPPMRRVVRA